MPRDNDDLTSGSRGTSRTPGTGATTPSSSTGSSMGSDTSGSGTMGESSRRYGSETTPRTGSESSSRIGSETGSRSSSESTSRFGSDMGSTAYGRSSSTMGQSRSSQGSMGSQGGMGMMEEEEEGSAIADKLKEAVTANPWAAIGASAGVGFFLGIMATGRGLRMGLLSMVTRMAINRLSAVAFNQALSAFTAHGGNGHDREMAMTE